MTTAAATVVSCEMYAGDAFDRAVERATRQGVQVCGMGRFKEHPARRFAIVNSTSKPGRYHVVSISDARLVCDCEAAQHGNRVCVHVAATSMYLTARAARIRRHEEAVERALREEDAARNADTARRLRELNARMERDARERDAAPLYRDNRGFSIFR